MSQRNERSTRPDLDGVTHWLVLHAARRAPESLSSRLEEEWLGFGVSILRTVQTALRGGLLLGDPDDRR